MRGILRRLTLVCLTTILLPQAPVPVPAQGLARAKVGASSVHRNCAACHKGHKGAMGGMTLKGSRPGRGTIDQICLSCHEGLNAAPTADGAPKLPAWSGQGSGHLKNRFSSRRAETYSRAVKAGTRTVRLAQDCSGCHDPHGKERGRLRATAFDTRGQLVDRKPMSVAEVCFGCHAGPEAAPLPSGHPDLGSLFAKGAASSHAIGSTAAARPELPSLRTSAFQGRLDCVSCHDNPDPAGARGPHVSPHASLLKAPFGREKDLARLGERVNDLCFLCHDKQSITANQSFPFHAQHLNGFTNSGSGSTRPQASAFSEAAAVLGIRSPKDRGPGRGGAYMPGYGEPATCATCHASHGSLRQAALIEFDRSVVTASSVGGPSFQRAGLGRGTCTLTCHGHDHVQTRY
ncbi:MAG: cytochrome c3 family protein [Geothrix sp.]|nr:cytochrome c3 family protein [Geothrix sp.]